MSLSRRGRQVLGDARGLSLVEVLIASFIMAVTLSAIGSVYVAAKQAFEIGASQAYVQRQGTLIQEQIARWAKRSVGIQVVDCGPNTTAGRSLAIADVNGTTRCIYQESPAADTDTNLLVCETSGWNGTCNGGTTYNMLNVMQSEVGTFLGPTLRVRNTTFTSVTCIDPGPCGAGAIGLTVTNPLVDVRFDLTDNTIPNPQFPTYIGMRFGFGITARN